MRSNDNESERAARLRMRAEAAARERGIPTLEDVEATSLEAVQQMIHELQVHQVELQMQNEELCRAQTELDAVRARYFDLYNLAPVGYFVVSLEGRILEVNLTAVNMLDTARAALVKQPISRFIFKDDQDIYYKHRVLLHKTGKPHGCELRMVKSDGTTFWVLLTAVAAQDPSTSFGQDSGDATVTRVVLSDITERKRLEKEKAQLEAQLQHARKPKSSSTITAAEGKGRHGDSSEDGCVR
jgi:PAS domain S-box-containing protein